MHAQVFETMAGKGRKINFFSFLNNNTQNSFDIVCEVQIYITHIQSQIGGRMVARTMFIFFISLSGRELSFGEIYEEETSLCL